MNNRVTPVEVLDEKGNEFDYLYPLDHRLGLTWRWARYPWDDDKIARSRLFTYVLVPISKLIFRILGRLF